MKNQKSQLLLSLTFCSLMFVGCDKPVRTALTDFNMALVSASEQTKQQQIAQKAIDYFISTTSVPDSIEPLLKSHLANNSSPKTDTSLFKASRHFSVDSHSASEKAEHALQAFLSNLTERHESADRRAFSSACTLARQIDAWKNAPYWEPLLRFLADADSQTIKKWRLAKTAYDLAGKKQQGTSEFALSKQLAVIGLRLIRDIPDQRLYFDLCYRLQLSTWFHDTRYHLATAIGEWIIAECRQLGYPLREASLEYNIASQLMTDRQFFAAIERYERALKLIDYWDFHGYWQWKWYYRETIRALAESYKYIGEIETALHFNNIYGEMASSNSDWALYHKLKAEIAADAAAFGEAESHFQKALSLTMKETPAGIVLENVYNSWAITVNFSHFYLKFDLPDEAEAVIERWEKNAGPSPELLRSPDRAALHDMYKARIFLRMEHATQRAESLLLKAEKFIDKIDSPKIKVQHLLRSAELYAAKKDYRVAMQHLEQASAICRENQFYVNEIKVMLQRAELARHLDSRTLADSLQHELDGIITRLEKFAHKQYLVRALGEAIHVSLKNRQPEQAQQFGQRLFKEIEDIKTAYRKNDDLVYLSHSVNKALKDAISVDVLVGAHDAALQKLNFAKGYGFEQKNPGEVQRSLNVQALQAVLAPEEAMIDYMVIADTVYAFILTGTGFDLVVLPEPKTTLQRKTKAFVDLLADQSHFLRKTEEQVLRDLYQKTIGLSLQLYTSLLAPLAPHLDGRQKLYIAPDGFLYGLPFSALASSNAGDTTFLIEQKAVLYLPGAWALSAKPASKLSVNANRVLASVDPKISSSGAFARALDKMFAGKATIRMSWPDKNQLKRVLGGQSDIAIFFSHAKADWENPAASFIEFPFQDDASGKFFYSDLDSLDLRATKLVILAACATTGSRVYLGTGLSGLQRAFLKSGARQVLATFWEVASDFTAKGIQDFLNSLNSKNDPALALQSMQQEAIRGLHSNALLYRLPFPQIWGAYALTTAVL